MSTLRSIILLTISIALLTKLHSLDVRISDAAFDFSSGTWLIDHANSMSRFFLYDGLKALLILLGLALIGIAIFSPLRVSRYINRREAVFLFICMGVVPGAVGAIKQNSGVSCPYAIQRYGGDTGDVRGEATLESFRYRESVTGCWPSGHASGGFALLALAFLNRPRRTRILLAGTSLSVGIAMGAYQILRGAHFASHIVITLCTALLLISMVNAVFPPTSRQKSKNMETDDDPHRPESRRNCRSASQINCTTESSV